MPAQLATRTRVLSGSNGNKEASGPKETGPEAEGIRHAPHPTGRPPSALPFLRVDAKGRLQVLHGLQPHLPAELLRRSGEGILAPPQVRRPLGCGSRTERGDPGTRRVRIHAATHLAGHDALP